MKQSVAYWPSFFQWHLTLLAARNLRPLANNVGARHRDIYAAARRRARCWAKSVGFDFAKTDHFIACNNIRASPSNAPICLRSAIASPVNRPCRRAFWFPLGAPDPGAPPCMRQRLLPRTAGERHDPLARVLAPQRGLASIGPILRK
jgi:hypothetical protein